MTKIYYIALPPPKNREEGFLELFKSRILEK
jgi:hypothetical protein